MYCSETKIGKMRPRRWGFCSRRDRDETLVHLEIVSRLRCLDRDHIAAKKPVDAIFKKVFGQFFLRGFFFWQFSDIFFIFAEIPDICKIFWHVQVFQTSGHLAFGKFSWQEFSPTIPWLSPKPLTFSWSGASTSIEVYAQSILLFRGSNFLDFRGQWSFYQNLSRSVLCGKKCTKFIFTWGFTPNPTGGSYDISQVR